MSEQQRYLYKSQSYCRSNKGFYNVACLETLDKLVESRNIPEKEIKTYAVATHLPWTMPRGFDV